VGHYSLGSENLPVSRHCLSSFVLSWKKCFTRYGCCTRLPSKIRSRGGRPRLLFPCKWNMTLLFDVGVTAAQIQVLLAIIASRSGWVRLTRILCWSQLWALPPASSQLTKWPTWRHLIGPNIISPRRRRERYAHPYQQRTPLNP
jgi:hypothetical protein